MALVRWDPFTEARAAMDRAIGESMRPLAMLRGLGEMSTMPLDVYQTPSDLVIKATIPGVNPDDVDITITGDTLTINAEIKEETVQDAEYLYRERRFGAVTRTISLPKSLKGDEAEASFDNGVLTLKIPKAEEAKPKQIKVKASGVLEGKK